MAEPAPRVFSIPAGAPFLPTLADALLAGRFGAIADPADDPLALADVTIFLPTRRAVRVLQQHFLERLGGRAAILPQVRPIGDVDEADFLLAPAESAADRLVLPPAIAPLDRQLVLTRLTQAWGGAIRRELLGLGENDPLLIPASAADAFHLAGDLARLIDDVETRGIAWSGLDNLVPDELARYWQISLDFLKIIAEQWPAYLAEKRLADPSVRRDRLIREEAARLADAPTRGIVLAAGSTGSIPATAQLLATIAGLPNGAVILPDLDDDLDAAGWAAIGGEGPTASPGHPQFGLRQLLLAIGIDRGDVPALAELPANLSARRRWISEAMRPAETTEAWGVSAAVPHEASVDVGLVVARTEQEEALAIALAMRDAIETPGASAALVTPDRRIAGRVAIELARFGLAVDDSAGRPLAASPPGVLLRLTVAAALSDGAPLDLLALAKHPLARFGMARGDCRRAIEAIDLMLFRGRIVSGGLAGLAGSLMTARQETDISTLGEEDWGLAAELAARMGDALGPLAALLANGVRTDASTATLTSLAALEAVAIGEATRDIKLFDDETGSVLAGLLSALSAGEAADLPLRGGEYPAFLDAAMAGVAVPARPGSDPRLFIWGALEARLQSADFVVLAGLDEGVWPSEARTDPWLSRSMRLSFGLEAPERRLGLSGHDFASALASPRVLVTRAERRGGTPTVAARWLQRLMARLGKDGAKTIEQRGADYLRWARRLDRSAESRAIGRPRPAPPLAARPQRLSVTEIETLVRDPYAIYARRILRLEPLDPIDIVPDAALRGSLIHEALGKFSQRWEGPFDAGARAALVEIGREEFSPVEAFPAVHALWWPRFLAIADWFIAWEAGRGEIAARHAEIQGSWQMRERFRLTGRADRIDVRRDGGLEILDFKTGSPPTAKQLSTGLAPQLALEVAMARHGAFAGIAPGASVVRLGWIGLGRVGKGEPFSSAVRDRPADDLGEEAALRLAELIAAYEDEGRAYVSRARPMFETRYESAYDHLARVREWSLAEGGEAEE